MDFWARVKETLDKGLKASKQMFDKAGDAAKDLGEKGVLRIEIRELESQVKDLLHSLGISVYQQLEKEGKASVTAKNPEVTEIIARIRAAEAEIVLREGKLELLKNQAKSPGGTDSAKTEESEED